MPFDTYGALRQAIADKLNRDDLTSAIADFVEIARVRANRDLANFLLEATVSLASGSIVLPAEQRNIRSLVLDGIGELRVVTPQYFEQLQQGQAVPAGEPMFATLVPTAAGTSTLRVLPPPNRAYTLRVQYVPVIERMAGDASTNVLLAQAPDVLFYAALVESASFLKDDERIAVWESRYQEAVAKLRMEQERRRYPNTPVVRVKRPIGA